MPPTLVFSSLPSYHQVTKQSGLTLDRMALPQSSSLKNKSIPDLHLWPTLEPFQRIWPSPFLPRTTPVISCSHQGHPSSPLFFQPLRKAVGNPFQFPPLLATSNKLQLSSSVWCLGPQCNAACNPSFDLKYPVKRLLVESFFLTCWHCWVTGWWGHWLSTWINP